MLFRPLRVEQFEDRTMLAVTASFASGSGVLSITGDGANDVASIEGPGVLGSVHVFTSGGSVLSINGGVRSIRVNLGAGDDLLNISALKIGGDLTVNMGRGADYMRLDNTPLYGPLYGPNLVGEVFIGGSVAANMGNNAGDYVEWVADFAPYSIIIGGNVRLTGVADVRFDGPGGSYLMEPRDITVGGHLNISTSNHGDVDNNGLNLSLNNVNVGGRTTLTGGASEDHWRIIDCLFAQRVTIGLGSGDDLLDIDFGNHANGFYDRVTVNGGSGTDTIDNSFLNDFSFVPVLTGIEIRV